MFGRIKSYFRKSDPSPLRELTGEGRQALYRRLRMQAFLAATLGYSFYYVCRTTLNVVKKPIIDSGILDAAQLGVIGSTLLIAYAVGKFVNGFIADHSNIRRLMAAGLILSAAVNLMVGITGSLTVSGPAFFIFFAVVWAVNGWGQSMGASPAIVSLSRWYPLRTRGTYYGFFSASHNLGEFLSYLFVGLIAAFAGWQWGFASAAIAGLAGVAVIALFLHDSPESKGLPPVEELTGEEPGSGNKPARVSTGSIQKMVLRTPAVWVLAAASAFMYISRYAVNSWGVLFLQEAKGYSLTAATQIISINALLGVIGTVFSGWFSDRLFKGDRGTPALIFGVLNTVALILFIYGGNSLWVNILSMLLFGTAIGVLICFLGGLMAVDIVPRQATGAAIGIVGIASYAAASLQEVVSGLLINGGAETVDGQKVHDFGSAALFWIGASVISFLLPLLNRRRKPDAM